MNQPRVFGPFDSPVLPRLHARSIYRATGSGYTVTLPKLASAGDGDRVTVQRHGRDTGTQPITFAAAAGDVLSDDRSSFDLANPGDVYVLEATTLSGLRSWTVVDMQTSSVPRPTAANYAPTVGALQDFIGRVRTEARDVNLLIVGDSTSAMAGSWARQLPAALAALFPRTSFEFTVFNDGAPGSYPAMTSVATGTGPRKVSVWIAAVAGKTWEYHLDATRREVMLAAPNPDLVLIANGHNENNTLAQAGTMEGLRGKAIVHIEQMRQLWAGASVVLMSQNPLTNFNVASENKADMYRRYATERGYGFLDVCRAFREDGRPVAGTLVSGDGVHPTADGFTVWLNLVVAAFKDTLLAQSVFMPPSTFDLARASLIAGSALKTVNGSNLPTNLSNSSNVSSVQDTTKFETGTFSLHLSKTAGGSISFIEFALPLAFVKGKTVTFAVRMLIPAGTTANAGQIAILDSTVAASDVWASTDQWIWRMVTKRIPANASYAGARILVDPSNGSAADLYIDRMVAVLGDMPAELTA